MELIKRIDRCNLRLDIYFSLTMKQRRKLNEITTWQFMEDIGINEFKKITKNSKIIALYIKLLRSFDLRLVS